MIINFALFLLGNVLTTSPQKYEFSRPVMGVEIKLIVYAVDDSEANKGAEKVFEIFEAFDLALSDYKSQSEINQLSVSAPHDDFVEVSPILHKTLKLSKSLLAQTDERFDVSIGPLSRTWRLARKRNRLPSTNKIDSAKSLLGLEHVELDETGERIKIKMADMQFDFGGIAKGLAADHALTALRQLGINSAMIDAGGDIVVGEPPPGKDGWLVRVPGKTMQGTLLLSNQAIATSGDLYQFFIVDGVRYSHIVDPISGQAITTPRIATVIADKGFLADAWASALCVGGKDVIQLASENGLKSQLIESTSMERSEFQIHASETFPDLNVERLEDNDAP